MKTLFFILSSLLLSLSSFGQLPEKMSFQAVIRDGSNLLVINQNVGVQISILQGNANGSAEYVEDHNVATNGNGLLIFEIGNGNIT